MISILLAATTAISLRVEGIYINTFGDTVSIVDCDLQRDRGFYYVDASGQSYTMDGTGSDEHTGNLTEIFSLSDVPAPQMQVGGKYRTERHDTVRICRTDDQVEGFPFRSDVGDCYNDKGERYHATPGSHLVELIG